MPVGFAAWRSPAAWRCGAQASGARPCRCPPLPKGPAAVLAADANGACRHKVGGRHPGEASLGARLARGWLEFPAGRDDFA